MTEPRKSQLHTGSEDYEVRRGTLVANEVTTVTFSSPVTKVTIRAVRVGWEADSIFATLEGTEPTATGTGDTGFAMIEVPVGETIALDKRTSVVKLRSAFASRFRVTGVR